MKWTDERVEVLKCLITKGLNQEEIASELNITRSSVAHVMRKHGLVTNFWKNKFSKDKYTVVNCNFCKKNFDCLTSENRKYCSLKCSSSANGNVSNFKGNRRNPKKTVQQREARSKQVFESDPEKYKLRDCVNCNITFATSKVNRFICNKCYNDSRPKRMKKLSNGTYNTKCSICDDLFTSDKTYKTCKKCSLGYYKIYRPRAEFKFNPYNFPKWFELDLLEKHGFYSPVNKNNNLNGVSRDHRLSVKEGYNNKIDTDYLSHPANCELMIHRDNSKKHTDSSIDFKQLLVLIDMFEELYPDHQHF